MSIIWIVNPPSAEVLVSDCKVVLVLEVVVVILSSISQPEKAVIQAIARRNEKTLLHFLIYGTAPLYGIE